MISNYSLIEFTETLPHIKAPLHTLFKVTPAAYTRSESVDIALHKPIEFAVGPQYTD
mgnify:CR=1 FL=1